MYKLIDELNGAVPLALSRELLSATQRNAAGPRYEHFRFTLWARLHRKLRLAATSLKTMRSGSSVCNIMKRLPFLHLFRLQNLSVKTKLHVGTINRPIPAAFNDLAYSPAPGHKTTRTFPAISGVSSCKLALSALLMALAILAGALTTR